MISLSFILTFIASVALCLGMKRHHRQIWGRAPEKQTVLLCRFGGWGLMAIGIALCVFELGGPLGFVTWFGLFAACTLMLNFALPYVAEISKR
ncbi:MAG: DUF3325 domain-containing protein [Emcibacteraceae bacterium]|nr:DUF3325 domain-containing protein [Emcibacteraceae bacterium]